MLLLGDQPLEFFVDGDQGLAFHLVVVVTQVGAVFASRTMQSRGSLTASEIRAAALGLDPVIEAHLDNTARTLDPAITAWRAIAGHWDLLSTGPNHGRGVSRVATELSDLVLRAGRLAYATPHWTPATGSNAPRDPATLAPTTADLRAVITALHHATGTLARIAATDHQAVRRAATDRRLYLPTRLLPASRLLPATRNIPRPYAPALASHLSALLDGYALAVTTCTTATAAFDALAMAAGTPSRALAAARALPAASPAHPAQQPERQLVSAQAASLTSGTQPGHLENEIRNLQLTEPALLLRASTIDEAARDLLAEATTKAHHQAAGRAVPPPVSGRRP